MLPHKHRSNSSHRRTSRTRVSQRRDTSTFDSAWKNCVTSRRRLTATGQTLRLALYQHIHISGHHQNFVLTKRSPPQTGIPCGRRQHEFSSYTLLIPRGTWSYTTLYRLTQDSKRYISDLQMRVPSVPTETHRHIDLICGGHLEEGANTSRLDTANRWTAYPDTRLTRPRLPLWPKPRHNAVHLESQAHDILNYYEAAST